MKTISKLILLLALTTVAACNVNSDNNQSLNYESLDVNFSAVSSGGEWTTEDVIGIVAKCTRNNETDVAMSTKSPACYSPLAIGNNTNLKAKDEDSRVITLKGDHNYSFYAFTPYDGSSADLTALRADVPSTVNFGDAVSQLNIAKKSASGVIAPISLEFKTPSCLVTLSIPDDIVNDEGNTLLKSMIIKPVNEAAFTGSIAYNATYNLYTDATSVASGSESKQITIDFGNEGYQMSPGYLPVTFLMAPFTVPEGAFQIVFTDTEGKTNTIPFLNKNEGEAYAAGSVIEQTMSSSSDGIIPCYSPVEWWIGGGGNHEWQDYPHITTDKKLGVFNYDTQPLWNPTNKGNITDDHIWTANQPQATIQYIYAEDHPSYTSIKLETNNFPQYKYSSPCIKGLWTGDYLEFKVPVKKFAANTEVSLSIPAYGRGAPLFWDIDYLDGEEWKTVTKTSHTSPDEQYTFSSTLMIPHGNSVKQWDGHHVSVKIPFTQAIPSGYLQIRFRVADGRYITINNSNVNNKTCKTIDAPIYDGTSLFAFINISEVYKSIKIEW